LVSLDRVKASSIESRSTTSGPHETIDVQQSNYPRNQPMRGS
jgi:hypothetical protein